MNKYKDVIISDESTFTLDLQKQMNTFGLTITNEQCHDFYRYYVALIEANKYMNLTGITDMHEVIIKHFVDSLSFYDSSYIQDGSKIIDIGTGAGFPGIPLAIYNRSLHITLFDSLQKRLNFLKSIIDDLALETVTTLHGRAEDMAKMDLYRESYDMAISRAVARLPILAEWALPYVRKGGYFISLKGAAYQEEISESGHALQTLGGKLIEARSIELPGLDDKRAVLYIEKIKSTPQKYPRKPKEIKEKPL